MSPLTIENVAAALTATDAVTVLIDGRSGSGKSTLADVLRAHWAASVVVRLDDIYPGWDGLEWASAHVLTELLQPRATQQPGNWRRWDWLCGKPAEWHGVAARQRLIVEGVGALHPASRALADLGIWIDADDRVRQRRALQRDGDVFRPHWDRWAAQEDAFIARCAPRTCADYLASETGEPSTWAFNPRPR